MSKMYSPYSTTCLNSSCFVGRLVTRQMFKKMAEAYQSEAILFSESLSATQVRSLIATTLPAAIIVKKGSLADHAAVLLNSRGTQLVIAPDFPQPPTNAFALIDGFKEELILSQSEVGLRELLAARVNSRRNIADSPLPFLNLSVSGKPVNVYVDGSTPQELKLGLQNGATGIGILRTEWLGWHGKLPPTFQDHLRLYQDAQDAVHPHSLNIRLLDIGGDKIPVWAQAYKALLCSPMGFRGIRAAACLSEAFSNQLDAICVLSQRAPVGIVVPMVTDSRDIKYVLEQIKMRRNPKAQSKIHVGAMVEVPSAVLSIKQILHHIDFVRIGPGDLTQFTLARLRSDLESSDLSGNCLHNAVLKLINETSIACEEFGKSLSMCLDLEPRTSLLSKLLGAGVRTFCVSSHVIRPIQASLVQLCDKG